jgi:hypothetical protein
VVWRRRKSDGWLTYDVLRVSAHAIAPTVLRSMCPRRLLTETAGLRRYLSCSLLACSQEWIAPKSNSKRASTCLDFWTGEASSAQSRFPWSRLLLWLTTSWNRSRSLIASSASLPPFQDGELLGTCERGSANQNSLHTLPEQKSARLGSERTTRTKTRKSGSRRSGFKRFDCTCTSARGRWKSQRLGSVGVYRSCYAYVKTQEA